MGDTTRILYAFDFDHTILHGNSDTEVTRLTDSPLPEDVRLLNDGTNWTQFMNRVFEFLHAEGVSIQDMEEFVKKMTPTPDMVSLLQEIQRRKTQSDSKLLVISDANDIFISTFFDSIGVKTDFIITNKASITPEGALHLEPYEDQESCAICPKNLCKGSALLEYLKTISFSAVVYVGDGRNDVCPGIKLSGHDFLFVRRGYNLEKILNVGKVKGRRNNESVEISLDIKAQVHFWDDANSIRNVIFT